MNRIKYVIGIDPGVTTGIARLNLHNEKINLLESMMIHNAMDFVQGFIHNSLIVVEDARKWNGWSKGQKSREMRAKAQGAGSVKRDCKIWEDFLTDNEAFFIMKSPSAKGAKINHKLFKLYTGWDGGRTNAHCRDAGMLIYGYTQRDVNNLWEQFNNVN